MTLAISQEIYFLVGFYLTSNFENLGNNISWAAVHDGNIQVYLYNANEVIQLSDYDSGSSSFRISWNSNSICWHYNDGNKNDIYIYKDDEVI
jgi:hypothetical protein